MEKTWKKIINNNSMAGTLERKRIIEGALENRELWLVIIESTLASAIILSALIGNIVLCLSILQISFTPKTPKLLRGCISRIRLPSQSTLCSFGFGSFVSGTMAVWWRSLSDWRRSNLLLRLLFAAECDSHSAESVRQNGEIGGNLSENLYKKQRAIIDCGECSFLWNICNPVCDPEVFISSRTTGMLPLQEWRQKQTSPYTESILYHNCCNLSAHGILLLQSVP